VKENIDLITDRTRYYPSQSDKQVLANALRALGIADWERWATACNDPNVYHQFLYGVILMHAPNIESLEIDDGELSHRLPTWLDVVKRSVQGDFSHLRLFEKLNSITIDLRHLRPLWHLAHVFRLPALETLNISGVVGLPFVIEMNPDHPTYELGGFMSEWGVRIDPRSSSVEKLSIHDSFVDTRILCKMMDSCRNLKSFMYQHSLEPYMYQVERDILGDYDVEGDGQFMADYAMLGDALRRQSQSLEYLDIEDLDRPAYGTAELGSLATLSKLKYFKGPLLGRPYNDAAPFFLELPRELETLSFPIRNQGELEVDKFMSAWHRIPSTFPNLRELRIPVTDSFILHNFRIRKAQMQEISPTLSRIQFSASKQDTIYRGEAIFYFDHIAT
jgi:hypothetical protein